MMTATDKVGGGASLGARVRLSTSRAATAGPHSTARQASRALVSRVLARCAGHSILAIALGALLASGCAVFTPPAAVHQVAPGVYWAEYEAARRGDWGHLVGDRFTICAQPNPDVAMETTAKLLLQVNYAGISGSLSPELASKVVELTGRTQTVLVLRETLYRICEQAAAGTLTREDLRALYADALATVRDMTAADRARATEGAARALDLLDVETQRLLDGLQRGGPPTP
jgi:hypothetical protein